MGPLTTNPVPGPQFQEHGLVKLVAQAATGRADIFRAKPTFTGFLAARFILPEVYGYIEREKKETASLA